MVNTLVQMQVRIFLYFHSILNLKPGLFQNVTSYPFMTRILRDGRAHIHALWFDIYTGEVHCFSRKHKVYYTRCLHKHFPLLGTKTLGTSYSETTNLLRPQTLAARSTHEYFLLPKFWFTKSLPYYLADNTNSYHSAAMTALKLPDFCSRL